MKYLNMQLAMLRSPEFIGAEPVERATWLCLLAYCADQENGGIIRGCRTWKDRQWQQLAGVTLGEVSADSALWQWAGDDLVVAHYPLEAEDYARTMRERATKGGKARKAAPDELKANAQANAKADAQADAQPNIIQGKVSKDNISQAETPTRGEVLEAAKLMGVDAQVAEIFFDEAESRPITPDGEWTDRNGQPMRNWRNALKAYGNKWLANARGTAFAQNGAAKALTRPEGVWSLEKRIEAAKAEIERIRGDEKNWMRRADKPWERELKPEAKDLMRGFKQQITDLQRQITGVAA